ncbi:hypothetical protein Q4Q35_19570 [Flavivirga aquimarina]|uniref:Uncharacterized protein n=1 Tax=Flavivirga aquimarina TaxID=2027862 RepID=A0ABT8WFT2_9FLAO|nr:hypothetical protein [Flavivirga aquimarina]MDO5972006.1 hypothetical protein [Flavivirga aquimarina]
MKEIFNRIIIDGAIIAVCIGVVAFVLKQYLTKIIGFKIDEKLEIKKVELEIKKERELNKLKQIGSIYPKVLESTYRLRNIVRDFVNHINSKNFNNSYIKKREFSKDLVQNIKLLRKNFKTLDDLVITSKAFLDTETHDKFHDFKNHVLQIEKDITLLEYKTDTDDFDLDELIFITNQIKEERVKIEALFEKITGNVKTKLNTSK